MRCRVLKKDRVHGIPLAVGAVLNIPDHLVGELESRGIVVPDDDDRVLNVIRNGDLTRNVARSAFILSTNRHGVRPE